MNPAEHHINSFNFALKEGMYKLVESFAPLEIVLPNTSTLLIKIEDLNVGYPKFNDKNYGSNKKLMPKECRLSRFSYSAEIQGNIAWYIDGVYTGSITKIMGYLPIMIKSDHCHLRDLDEKALILAMEEFSEFGGYFIINGLEKLIRPILIPRRNYPIALIRPNWKRNGICHTEYGVVLNSVKNECHYSNQILHYLNNGSVVLSLFYQNQRMTIPLIPILKALTNLSDKQIYEELIKGTEWEEQESNVKFYRSCVLNMLRKYATTLYSASTSNFTYNNTQTTSLLKSGDLQQYFLPQCDGRHSNKINHATFFNETHKALAMIGHQFRGKLVNSHIYTTCISSKLNAISSDFNNANSTLYDLTLSEAQIKQTENNTTFNQTYAQMYSKVYLLTPYNVDQYIAKSRYNGNNNVSLKNQSSDKNCTEIGCQENHQKISYATLKGTKELTHIENEIIGAHILESSLLIDIPDAADKFRLLIHSTHKLFACAKGLSWCDSIDTPAMQEVLLPGQIVLMLLRYKLQEFMARLKMNILKKLPNIHNSQKRPIVHKGRQSNIAKEVKTENNASTIIQSTTIKQEKTPNQIKTEIKQENDVDIKPQTTPIKSNSLNNAINNAIGANNSQVYMDIFTTDYMNLSLSAIPNLTRSIEYFFATGNLVCKEASSIQQASGYTIMAEKINYNRYLSHFRSVHRGSHMSKTRISSVRKLTPDAWGFLCAVHTPDGAPCGLLNHLTRDAKVVSQLSYISDVSIASCNEYSSHLNDNIGKNNYSFVRKKVKFESDINALSKQPKYLSSEQYHERCEKALLSVLFVKKEPLHTFNTNKNLMEFSPTKVKKKQKTGKHKKELHIPPKVIDITQGSDNFASPTIKSDQINQADMKAINNKCLRVTDKLSNKLFYYPLFLDGRQIAWVPEPIAKSVCEEIRKLKTVPESSPYKIIPSDMEIVLLPKNRNHTSTPQNSSVFNCPANNGPNPNPNIKCESAYPAIHCFSRLGRLTRPVYNLLPTGGSETNNNLDNATKNLAEKQTSAIEWIGSLEQTYLHIPIEQTDIIKGETWHMEIRPDTFLSITAGLVPFSEFNQSPRNMYQCQMCKQTLGSTHYTLPFKAENKAYRLQTPQKSLVKPISNERLCHLKDYPSGTNAIVAVISYTGYDMEDAMVINRQSAERGFAQGYLYKSEILDIQDVVSDSLFEPKPIASNFDGDTSLSVTNIVLKPKDKLSLFCFGFDVETCVNLTFYEKKHPQNIALDSDGLPYVGAIINQDTAYYAYMNRVTGKCKIIRYKGSESFTVDKVFVMGHNDVNASDIGVLGHTAMKNETLSSKSNVTFLDFGVKKAVIFLRMRRDPSIGDKFASRQGQKGICSYLIPHADLPFTESGLVPDIIFNPHGFPSRMTIGMIIECMAGKSAAMHGEFYDATPFKFSEKHQASHYFSRLLANAGYNYYGTEMMFSGVDGRMLKVDIFMGIIYYQRLRHMVADKYQVRTTGPVDSLTHQPLKGRKRAGGIRCGEMERDALISHGASMLLQDRLLNCSDACIVPVCPVCKTLVSANHDLTPTQRKRMLLLSHLTSVQQASSEDTTIKRKSSQLFQTNTFESLIEMAKTDKSILSCTTDSQQSQSSPSADIKCKLCGGKCVYIKIPYVLNYLTYELMALNIKLELNVQPIHSL